MDILLDTHILLWHLSDDDKLSLERSNLLNNLDNTNYISIASIWEIAIKQNIGKLRIQQSIYELIPDNTTILGIDLPHINQLQNLPFHHKDPFDRMIIAQAKVENLNLMSSDGAFEKYDVNLI